MTGAINRRQILLGIFGVAAAGGATAMLGPRFVEGAQVFVRTFTEHEEKERLMTALSDDAPVPEALVDNVLTPSMGTRYGALSRYLQGAFAENDVVFFGDTNHGDIRRKNFSLQDDVLHMLAVAGCDKGFYEIGRERQELMDRLAHSRGQEADKQAFIDAFIQNPHNGHVSAQDLRTQVERIADGIVDAQRYGIHIYAADHRPSEGFSNVTGKNTFQLIIDSIRMRNDETLDVVRDDARLADFLGGQHEAGNKMFVTYGSAHSQGEYDVDDMLAEKGIKATQVLLFPDRAAARDYMLTQKAFEQPARFSYIMDEDLIFDRQTMQLTRTPDFTARAGSDAQHGLEVAARSVTRKNDTSYTV